MEQKRLDKCIVVGIPLFTKFLAPQPDLHYMVGKFEMRVGHRER
jgi:hypothetical protein